MAVLPVTKLGNPLLREVSQAVDRKEVLSAVFQRFLDDMFETMVEEEGIGLAAPQVGVSKQVLVMECEGEIGFPLTVLINPTILLYGPQLVENWEGCLSVDGLHGKVTRPSMVRVRAMDRQGIWQEIEASGLYAVCIQHEIDHLIGKLFLDRMTDLSTLTQTEEFDLYWRKESAMVI